MPGLDASLDLCTGTFIGKEVASKKSVTRFLLIISGCIGLNSGLEEDKEDLLLEVVEENIAKRQRGWTDRQFGDDGDDEVGRGRLIQRPA